MQNHNMANHNELVKYHLFHLEYRDLEIDADFKIVL